MTLNEKIVLGSMLLISTILFIVIFSLNNKLNKYESKLKTYESALENTSDANVFEIDNLKNQIQARENSNNKARQIIRDKYCAELIKRKAMPHRFVADGTCEVE